MSKYTGAPWRVSSSPLGGVGVVAGSEHGGTVLTVCRVTGAAGNHATQADARLIAAAPDLLEALEDCERLARALYRDEPVEDASEVLGQCLGAIRKARGGQ